MPAVPWVLPLSVPVPLVAVPGALVGAGALVPVVPVVVTFLLVLARVVGALAGAAAGARRAAAAGFARFVRRVFVVFGFLVAAHLGALVGRAVVELPRGGIAAAPRAAL